MTARNLCIEDLNSAIALNEQIKISIRQGRYRTAINQIADLLFGRDHGRANAHDFRQQPASRVLRLKRFPLIPKVV